MSTEDDGALEREAPIAGSRPDWIPPERRAEIRDEKLPMLQPRSPRYRADQAEARHRTEVESFGVRERSGPPIMGLIVIYAVLVAAVAFCIWFAGNGYGWW